MYPVSAAFLTAIQASARNMSSRITINFTDLFADPTASGNSLDENRVSQVEQISDSKTANTYKWLAADGNNILDGSYHPCPDDAVANSNEIGWWSQTLSNSSAIFATPVVVNATFAKRKVTALLVVGDDKREEYPVDFTLKLYNDAALEHTEIVTANTGIYWQTTISEETDINKIELSISKWSHATRVAKIAEVSCSVTRTYDGSDIMNFTVNEQREVSNDNSIPAGNIAAASLNLTLQNASREFDANNTLSPLHGVVRPNNKVTVEICVKTTTGFEYVPVFIGWTRGWNVPENSIEASVQALDILDFLNQSNISTSTVQTGLTFSAWFVIVLNDAGLDSSFYNIDTTLAGADYIVPFGWFSDVSHREALTILATACSASVYQDRAGIIQIEAVDFLDSNYLTSVQTFNRTHYMDKSNQPIYENIANKIVVTTQPLVKTTSVLIYETTADEPETIAASTTTDFTIFYTDAPVDDQVATISPSVSGVTINSYNHYSWGSVLTVQNTNGSAQDLRFSVTGSTFEVKGKQTVTRSDTTSIINNGVNKFGFPDNAFVQKKALAVKIAGSLLSSFADPERDLTANFEPGGNPALEMGDRITLLDLYQSKEYNIVSSVISFDGGMSQQIKGRVS
ncbi:MAG: hypothetical protein GY861_03465 [bacterium]|nr:hypothetical protein [bacterium]